MVVGEEYARPGAKYELVCMLCGSVSAAAGLAQRCRGCSGALDARLRLDQAAPSQGSCPELTYLDFLPLHSDHFIDQGMTFRTPCRGVPTLGAAIGVPRLWVKDESVLPTGSTKDRMAAMVVAVLRQFGIKEFVASSTGNSSTALARAVRRDGAIRAHFFCGVDFATQHQFDTDDQVTLKVLDGSYASVSVQAQRFATEEEILWEGGFFNWARREGLKLAYLEAFDDMDDDPDVVVQAISSGMGALAAYKGSREYLRAGQLKRIPRILMVQQDTCAPMVEAWAQGRREMSESDVVRDPRGLATAILLGDGRPYYPYLATIAERTAGAMISVSQSDLIEARRLIRDLVGVDVCYASAATVAGVRQEAAAGRIAADEAVLVNLTGTFRKAS